MGSYANTRRDSQLSRTISTNERCPNKYCEHRECRGCDRLPRPDIEFSYVTANDLPKTSRTGEPERSQRRDDLHRHNRSPKRASRTPSSRVRVSQSYAKPYVSSVTSSSRASERSRERSNRHRDRYEPRREARSIAEPPRAPSSPVGAPLSHARPRGSHASSSSGSRDSFPSRNDQRQRRYGPTLEAEGLISVPSRASSPSVKVHPTYGSPQVSAAPSSPPPLDRFPNHNGQSQLRWEEGINSSPARAPEPHMADPIFPPARAPEPHMLAPQPDANIINVSPGPSARRPPDSFQSPMIHGNKKYSPHLKARRQNHVKE
jgi:hypothetical protein